MNRHCAQSGGSITNIGKHPLARELSLPELRGRTLDLSVYRGKIVLVDFWLPGVIPAGRKSRISWDCRTAWCMHRQRPATRARVYREI